MAENAEIKKESVHSGVPMSEESEKEWKQSFTDIEDSIKLVMKNGTDL